MTATCKGCGAPIEWAEINGAKIPLDTRPPIYMWYDGPIPGWQRAQKAAVTHFATCPKANDFSRSKKREEKP